MGAALESCDPVMIEFASAVSCLVLGLLILVQDGLDSSDLILGRLLLVCSRSNSDIALDSHNAILMQQRVRLTDDSHDLVPRTLYEASF